LGGGEISGSAVATVASGISGLGPETHYVFRIVAESECNGPGVPLCEVEGAATHFATYAETTTGLPDGRAYELVSPAQKSGGQVFPAAALRGSCDECKPPGVDVFAVFPMQSAPGGNSVVYSGSPFSPNEGAAVLNSYLSRRTSNGWSTTAMSPDLLSASGGKNETYDSQLARGIISQDSPQLSPQAPIGYANLYLQSAGNPQALQPLLTKDRFAIHPPKRGPGDLKLSYSGSSADYSAHFFSANDALADATTYAPESPDPGFSGRNLYEWRGGALALVNVLPSNTEVAANASFASVSPDAYGISQNGRRVFWEAEGQLYVREDNRTTREIHHPGQFLEASPDGLQVLLSDGCLYSLTTATCTDLTDGKGGFQGIVGATKDLSKIYFIDQAALTAEAEAGKCQVVGTGGRAKEEELEGRVPPGWGCNLYSWESGTAPTLVATLLAADNVSTAQGGTWAAAPGKRTAQASPSGRYLAFVSKARLASNSPEVPCKLHSAEPTSSMITCEEVYLYDSKTNDVICPSCNPAGEAPLGISNLRLIEKAPAVQAQPRYLTDSGRLVFDSQDRLSPLDTNSGVEDVYQFEPQGTGSCSRASGCVSLISSGSGSVDSNFLAMDESGANIFFTSRERLVQKDMDELIDIYDAREFGGFPTESESQRTECQGESCQPVPQPPDDATPASSTFHGAGNVKEGASHRKKRKHKKRRHHRRKHHSRTAGDKRAVNHQGRGAK
jgi:hypothetical protein